MQARADAMPGDPARSILSAPTVAELDLLLTAQLAVAWAGEGHVGEEPRLGWWRSDLTSEFGGRDLFQRLLPRTAPLGHAAGRPRGRPPHRRRAARAGQQPRRRHLPVPPRLRPRRAGRGAPPASSSAESSPPRTRSPACVPCSPPPGTPPPSPPGCRPTARPSSRWSRSAAASSASSPEPLDELVPAWSPASPAAPRSTRSPTTGGRSEPGRGHPGAHAPAQVLARGRGRPAPTGSARPPPDPSRAERAFDEYWFGARSLPRVKVLLANFRARFDAFPAALARAAALAHMDPQTRRVVCHWHLQLSDPLYRAFTGTYLVERHASRPGQVRRDAVIAWVGRAGPGRWTMTTTRIQFASKLLSAAYVAGLVPATATRAARPSPGPRRRPDLPAVPPARGQFAGTCSTTPTSPRSASPAPSSTPASATSAASLRRQGDLVEFAGATPTSPPGPRATFGRVGREPSA
jgi:hypothetical protein